MSDDDEFGPDATVEDLKLRFKLEREGHAREIEQLRSEFSERLSALQGKTKRGQGELTVIHPEDYKTMLTKGTPGVDEITEKLRRGEIRISLDAPRDVWAAKREKIGVIALLRLPLHQYEKIWDRIQKGEVEVVGEG